MDRERHDSDEPFGGAKKIFAEELEKVVDEKLARNREVVRASRRRVRKGEFKTRAKEVEVVKRAHRPVSQRRQKEKRREAREESR